jgi:hypothetical protein
LEAAGDVQAVRVGLTERELVELRAEVEALREAIGA